MLGKKEGGQRKMPITPLRVAYTFKRMDCFFLECSMAHSLTAVATRYLKLSEATP